MKYNVGGKLTTKKPHACGCFEWTVTRTGADVKLKCDKCGHQVFLNVDKVDKIAKKYVDNVVVEN